MRERFQFEFPKVANGCIRHRKLTREEVLFSIGAPVECIYRVARGSVRTIVYPDDGKPLVLYRAEEGETFAEDHLFCDMYRYEAIACENTLVESLARSRLIQELQNHPPQLISLVECLCRRFQHVQENFHRIAIADSKRRVLDLLCSLAVSRNGHLDCVAMKGRIKSYADDLNLSHEATYRALRKLEADGSILRLDDGSIRVAQNRYPI